MKLNRKGVTIVELIAVIVILGIIAAIAIPTIGNIISNTRKRADQATVLRLNQATYYYILTSPENVDAFVLKETNDERIQELIDRGFLDSTPKMQHPDSSYDFDGDHRIWCYISCGAITDEFPFSNPDFSISDFPSRTGNQDHFSIENNVIIATPPKSSDDILFFQNPRIDYTIDVSFELQPRLSNNWGGIGILFETIFNQNDPSRDHGYILQFDRHYGQIVIRRRNNGNEGGNNQILLRYNVLFNSENEVSYALTTSNDINRDVRSQPWWEEVHHLSLMVHLLNQEKHITVIIDGTTIFTWLIPDPIKETDAALNHTGIRVWWDVPVKIFNFSISD